MKSTIEALEKFLTENRDHEHEIKKIFIDWFLHFNEFQLRYGDRPSWCLEKYEPPEMPHIHFWDYALDRISPGIEKYCRENGLKLIPEAELILPHLTIHDNDKKILEVHDTFCSTPSNPYVCFHTTLDPKALRFLTKFPFYYQAISIADINLYTNLINAELNKRKHH
jgi:hypothetical protein